MVTMSNRDSIIVPCQSCGASVSKYAMSCPYCEALLAGKPSRTGAAPPDPRDQAVSRRPAPLNQAGTKNQADCNDKAA